jgi:hypothetical protein
VVLASYDSGVRISINWSEFLAHLTNYRNPFLSVQLLPRFLEPEDYIYKPIDDESFSPDETEDSLAIIKRGPVAIDGGSQPDWSASFR